MVDCPVMGTSVFIHAGYPTGNSCQWCLLNIGREFEGKEEPYALPAHEHCHCYWQKRYDRRGLSWFNYNQVEKLLDEAKKSIKTEDEWKAEDARLQLEALDTAETALDDAETATATAEAYGAQAETAGYNYGVQLGLMNDALAVRDAQQAIMDAALADAALHQGEADAAEASRSYYQAQAVAAQANYDDCQETITEYQGIQAAQQAIMDAASADKAVHQGEASAAQATELAFQDDLDAANVEYSGVEDEIQAYLDIQAAQQAIIDAANADIAIQQGLANAAAAEEAAFNASANAYLDDYYAVLETIAAWEAIQATQQGLMNAADAARIEDEASCAQYEDYAADHLLEADSFLEDYNAAIDEYDLYNGQAEEHAADMAYWAGIYSQASEDADTAWADYEEDSATAVDCENTANEWYELAEQYYNNNDIEMGDYCTEEGDAAWALAVQAYDLADAHYSDWMDAIDQMQEADENYDTATSAYNEDYALAQQWLAEANEIWSDYNAAMDAANEDQATADDYSDQAAAHQLEWDEAKDEYDAHDTANLEIEAADLLDCYNEELAKAQQAHADYLAILDVIAGYQATKDAAQAIYDAHDTAPLYAELDVLQGQIDTAQAGVTQYHNLYLAALAAAQDAQDTYDAALAIYNAHDTTQLQADAAGYLAAKQAAEAQAAIYLGLWEDAIAAAEEAIGVYDAALAIYNANEENITNISTEMAWQLYTHDNALVQQDLWEAKAEEYVAIAEAAMDTYEELGSDFEERHEVSEEDLAYIDRLTKCLQLPIIGDDSPSMSDYYNEKYSSDYFD